MMIVFIPDDLHFVLVSFMNVMILLLAGHLGKDKTIDQVKRRFYWLRMDEEIQQYVTSCDPCQRNKPSQRPRLVYCNHYQYRSSMATSSMDLITQLPRSKLG